MNYTGWLMFKHKQTVSCHGRSNVYICICSRDVRKTEIRFGFGFLKPNGHRTVQKFDIRSDGFSTETACKFAIYVKSDKKLLYLHSNVHIKNSLNTTETEIST